MRKPRSDSPRQILHLAELGKSVPEIAKTLKLHVETVRKHLKRMGKVQDRAPRGGPLTKAVSKAADGMTQLEAYVAKHGATAAAEQWDVSRWAIYKRIERLRATRRLRELRAKAAQRRTSRSRRAASS